jgi:hypothetical protein
MGSVQREEEGTFVHHLKDVLPALEAKTNLVVVEKKPTCLVSLALKNNLCTWHFPLIQASMHDPHG